MRVRLVAVARLILLLLSAPVDIASAQIPARVETPYTRMDAETRKNIEGGVETPLRGNGPFTGYGYFLYTRPHFLDEDLYLRLVIPPGYFISELIRDHWPSQNSAIGFGISGGLWADSQVEFRDGRFEKDESFSGHSAGGTLAYYLRGPKIAGVLPLEGQIRTNAKYVLYDRTSDTSSRFRLPENSAIYGMRAGVRLGGVPPELFPNAALEASVWHTISYRDQAGRYGFAERREETEHLTQRTWTRVGGIYTWSGTQVSAFLNAGIAEDTDPLSAFRMGRRPPPARRISPHAPRLQRRGDLRATLRAREPCVPVSDLARPGPRAPPALGRLRAGGLRRGSSLAPPRPRRRRRQPVRCPHEAHRAGRGVWLRPRCAPPRWFRRA